LGWGRQEAPGSVWEIREPPLFSWGGAGRPASTMKQPDKRSHFVGFATERDDRETGAATRSG